MKIKTAKIEDIQKMVAFSHEKRLQYSKIQPNFWKMADSSDEIQAEWFKELLNDETIIAFVADEGFIIGKIINPPEVYDAGLTLMIDDFCVQNDDIWLTVGKNLLEKCIESAKEKGAKQILVVCGHHDKNKKELLDIMGLNIASNWYTNLLS